jgi:hypothetical protein
MSRTPAGKEGVNQLAEGAQVTFRRRAFAASEAAAHFLSLQAASPESPWQQQTLTVVGRRVRTRVLAPPCCARVLARA